MNEKMFKCNDCECVFEENAIAEWRDYIGEYGGEDVYEHMYGCPVCRGSFQEIVPCEKCGGYDNKNPEDPFCEECASEIIRKFRVYVLTNFSEKEREFLEENTTIL